LINGNQPVFTFQPQDSKNQTASDTQTLWDKSQKRTHIMTETEKDQGAMYRNLNFSLLLFAQPTKLLGLSGERPISGDRLIMASFQVQVRELQTTLFIGNATLAT
jgi:hypothetical protein